MTSLLLAAWISALAAAPAGGTPEDPTVDAEPLRLPMTIERLWYRSDAKRRLFNRPGELTINDEALEFVGRKKTVAIPLSRIHIVSLGKMKGDVDTDWVIVGVGEAGALERVGFRDGTKLGYGLRTAEVFETLKRVMRSVSAAQYCAPEGFETFEEIEDQLTLAVPLGWDTHVDSLVFVDGRPKFGTILFSEEPLRQEAVGDDGRTRRVQDEAAIDRARNGDVSSFFVDRSEAESGVRCDRISPRVRKTVLQRVSDDALFHRGEPPASEPQVSDVTVDGCAGLRIVAQGRRADGEAVTLDVVATTHAGTLFVFGVRSKPENVEEHRATFASAVTSVRFSVAR